MGLVLLGTTAVRGVARLDPVAVVVPLVLGAAVATVLVKALDRRIERRRHVAPVLDAPALLALRGRHGLARFDVAEVPPWLAGVPALHERVGGERVRVVAALRRGHDLVVALVAGEEEDDGPAPRDLVVVRRLAATVPAFHVTPRRPAVSKVAPDVEDLYRVSPGAAVLPAPLSSWLTVERPRLRLEGGGEWLVVLPATDHPPQDADAIAAVVDELIAAAERVAAVFDR